MATNRIRNVRCKLDPSVRVCSLWQCEACLAELVTTPGGPAPKCPNCDGHPRRGRREGNFMTYRGGKLVYPGDDVTVIDNG